MFLKKNVPTDVQQTIEETLKNYRSANFPAGVLFVATLLKMTLEQKKVIVYLSVPFPCQSELAELALGLSESLASSIEINTRVDMLPVRRHSIVGVTNIIAVSSGKGGVGKSTTAVNLAYALQAEGAKVGVLDADIYGPSIPTLLGVKGHSATSADGKQLTPINANGLNAMSIGFLVPDDDATIWRGPMASKAFNQMLNETAWPDLDYLIVDLPPGTGDIQLTLAQKVPVAASVIVTTPQDIALHDAIKGIAMFEKVKVPVLGIIENMSYHLCENCGHHSHLFGQGGGEIVAKNFKTLLLGQLPLNIQIRTDADNGVCAINENSTGEIAQLYRKIASKIAAQLFLQLDARSPETATITVK